VSDPAFAEGSNATTWTDTNVAAGHTYTYRHKAFSDATSNTVTCPPSGGTGGTAGGILKCAPQSQTVAVGQSATMVATGGSGIYRWDLYNNGVMQDGGNEYVSVKYATVGAKIARVTSGTQNVACAVTVVAVGTAGGAGGTLLSLVKTVQSPAVSGTIEQKTAQASGGETLQFTLRVTNDTAAPIDNVIVRDTVPPGMSYVSSSTTVGGQPAGNDLIVASGLSLNSVAPGASVVVQWSAVANRVAEIAPGPTQSKPVATVESAGVAGASDSVTVTVFGTGTGTGVAAGTPSSVATGPGDAVLLALIIASGLTMLYSAYTRSPTFRSREVRQLGERKDPMDFRS
jgi:uncharacterized repeat protein (TIGR01451 family)